MYTTIGSSDDSLLQENIDDWPSITPSQLLEYICDILDIPISLITDRSRDANLVKSRAIFFYLGNSIFDFGPSILGLYAKRDHSDVCHHLKRYYNYLDSSKPWYGPYFLSTKR